MFRYTPWYTGCPACPGGGAGSAATALTPLYLSFQGILDVVFLAQIRFPCFTLVLDNFYLFVVVVLLVCLGAFITG